MSIDLANAAYRRPLEQGARALRDAVGPDCDVVLLGSIASGKYVEVLQPIFGDRLVFPPAFVGRGDMSRGGLMLRCVLAGVELEYAPVAGATRHGQRPPKLAPIKGILGGDQVRSVVIVAQEHVRPVIRSRPTPTTSRCGVADARSASPTCGSRSGRRLGSPRAR